MTYDYTYLYQELTKQHVALAELASLLHLPLSALQAKLASKEDFTQEEIHACIKALHLEPSKIHLYFFTLK